MAPFAITLLLHLLWSSHTSKRSETKQQLKEELAQLRQKLRETEYNKQEYRASLRSEAEKILRSKDEDFKRAEQDYTYRFEHAADMYKHEMKDKTRAEVAYAQANTEARYHSFVLEQQQSLQRESEAARSLYQEYSEAQANNEAMMSIQRSQLYAETEQAIFAHREAIVQEAETALFNQRQAFY